MAFRLIIALARGTEKRWVPEGYNDTTRCVWALISSSSALEIWLKLMVMATEELILTSEELKEFMAPSNVKVLRSILTVLPTRLLVGLSTSRSLWMGMGDIHRRPLRRRLSSVLPMELLGPFWSFHFISQFFKRVFSSPHSDPFRHLFLGYGSLLLTTGNPLNK